MSLQGRSISEAPLGRTAVGTNGTHGTFDVRSSLTLLSRSDDRAGAVGAENGVYPTDGVARHVDRIAIRSRSSILFLDAREIAWLEAYGNYVRFHVIASEGGATATVVHTVRGTLSSFEENLDPTRFVRIHRSVIVNVQVVRELHSRRTGDFTLVTRGGAELTLSRNFRSRVPELRRLLAAS
jgi:DNA-binding LytR/AlgR family response regulator